LKVDWLTFWICALACYRVTVLIARDIGPFKIFQRLRKIDRCSKLLKCPFCVSVYVGSATSASLWLAGYQLPIVMWFMLSLAFSAVTIVLDRTFTADITND